MNGKLNVNDLLASLNPKENKEQLHLSKFAQNVVKDKNRKINVLSKKQQEMMKRQSNYQMAKQQMDKWVGIVKMNRQKQSLNFVQKDIGNLNVNFFAAQPMNDFQKKIQSKLEKMNVKSQKDVLKHQQAILQKVDPQQAKRRLIQARKHRTAIFYEQQKRRRIAKIKSKLYHKIKKRQKLREETKKVEQMNPSQRNQYIENLTKKRIKQRITLRHNTKNKHIKNLLRFNRNQKNSIQTQINEVNNRRHKQLERLDQQMMQQISQQYDDENFRQQAMKDLQAQIEAIENRQNGDQNEEADKGNSLDDLPFIKNANKNKLKTQKQQAYKLLSKLQNGKQIKEKDVNSEMEDQNNQDQSEQSQKQGAFRGVIGKKIQDHIEQQNPHKQNNKKKSIQSELKNYLLGGNINQPIEGDRNQQLIKGINVKNLQNKYQPQRVPIDLSALIAQNKQIYEGQNQAILENVRQFQQQKMNQIQQQVNKKQEKNKNLKGWGSWAGPGINQRRVDPQQQLRKKLRKIQQIKKKRKDNALAHVIINQSRNKNLSQYFVRDLPHNFTNADQFDFMQSQPIGPEWNSLTQFKDNIKPKVITQAGQVITPAKLPKKMENSKNSKERV